MVAKNIIFFTTLDHASLAETVTVFFSLNRYYASTILFTSKNIECLASTRANQCYHTRRVPMLSTVLKTRVFKGRKAKNLVLVLVIFPERNDGKTWEVKHGLECATC
jgi:hypothetical protein